MGAIASGEDRGGREGQAGIDVVDWERKVVIDWLCGILFRRDVPQSLVREM